MSKNDEKPQCSKKLLNVNPEHVRYLELSKQYKGDLETMLKAEGSTIRGLVSHTRAAKDQLYLAWDSTSPTREKGYQYHIESKEQLQKDQLLRLRFSVCTRRSA